MTSPDASLLHTLLIEVGTEELPAIGLKMLSDQLQIAWIERLAQAGYHSAAVQSFCTPRRLAVRLQQLRFQPNPEEAWKIGPPKSLALDEDGQFTLPASRWAERLGIPLSATTWRICQGKARLAYQSPLSMPDLKVHLGKWLEETLLQLKQSKKMYWGDVESWRFVRPIRWITILMDDALAGGTCFDCPITSQTYGHRYLAPHDRLTLHHAKDYEVALAQKGEVIVDFNIRLQSINKQLREAADRLDGIVVEHAQLCEEVTGLTEKPYVGQGRFSETFLQLPECLLYEVLAKHQRCYLVRAKEESRLLPYFLFVGNLPITDRIRQGNEKVVDARLKDALFFYKQDLARSLTEMNQSLGTLVVHEHLGTQRDKVDRLRSLVRHLAEHLGQKPEIIETAAQWCKADLSAQLVIEYADLVGLMGAHYAMHAGIDPEVCTIIQEHVYPSTRDSILPNHPCAVLLSLVDKVDHIVGWFGIGKQPSSQKDPFGLRRCAISIIRLLVEKSLPIDLSLLIQASYALYPADALRPETITEVLAFVEQRFQQWSADQGISIEIIEASVDQADATLADQYKRLQCLMALTHADGFLSIYQASKRATQLLNASFRDEPLGASATISPERPTQTPLPAAAQKLEACIQSVQRATADPLEPELRNFTQLAEATHHFLDHVFLAEASPGQKSIYQHLLFYVRRFLNQFGHLESLNPARGLSPTSA